MTGLLLGKRADVLPKERVDKSGLSRADYLVIDADLVLRQADEAAQNVVRCDRLLAKVSARLDDSALAATHPPGDPDRVSAEIRHYGLGREKVRHLQALRRYAKEFDKLVTALPRSESETFARTGLAWYPSPIWECARLDVVINKTANWPEWIRQADERLNEISNGVDPNEPPF